MDLTTAATAGSLLALIYWSETVLNRFGRILRFYHHRLQQCTGHIPIFSKNSTGGLPNYSNNCYINSIIQGLSSLKGVTHWLERAYDIVGSEDEIISHLKDINHCLSQKIPPNISNIDLYSIYYSFIRHLHHYDVWNQAFREEDAFEFFVKLIDHVSTSIKFSCLQRYSNNPHNTFFYYKKVFNSKLWVDLPQTFYNPFVITFARSLSCFSCRDVRYTAKFERSNYINLSLKPGNFYSTDTTIEQLLNKFFGEEFLSDFRCKFCSNLSVKSTTRIAQLPETLCIYINRIYFTNSGYGRKMNYNVFIRPILYLNDLMYKFNNSTNEPRDRRITKKLKYKLKAVINHHGDYSNTGHYTCTKLWPTQTTLSDNSENQAVGTSIMEISDETCKKVGTKFSTLNSSTACILFYDKIEI